MGAKNVVLLGRSGSGKGTQAKLLLRDIANLVYISTGDLFRILAAADTVASKKISETLSAGKFVLDDIAIAFWVHALCCNVKEEQGFILDGAPRTELQAIVFDRILDFLGLRENTFFILLEVSRHQAFTWLLERSRSDDDPKSINNRLDLFEKEVLLVIEYYEKQGRLIRVNGERSVEDVRRDILRALGIG